MPKMDRRAQISLLHTKCSSEDHGTDGRDSILVEQCTSENRHQYTPSRRRDRRIMEHRGKNIYSDAGKSREPTEIIYKRKVVQYEGRTTIVGGPIAGLPGVTDRRAKIGTWGWISML